MNNVDWLSERMKKDGWWACKYCSNNNWDVFHRVDEAECPKTHKPRSNAEKVVTNLKDNIETNEWLM